MRRLHAAAVVRAVLFALMLLCSACDSDNQCSYVPHYCDSCCDPICAGKLVPDYGCPNTACSEPGYVCHFFEHVCTCNGSSWEYEWTGQPQRPDLAVPHVIEDLATGD